MKFQRTVKIAKYDAPQRIASGVVYLAGVPDTQGDMMFAEELEKSAYDYLENGRVDRIDLNHDGKPSGAKVIESYISKGGDFPAGSWVMSIRAPAAVWQDIEKGALTGFSFAGSGERHPTKVDGRNVNELRNVRISHVSLVAKGANKTPFQILKSEEPTLNAKQIQDAIAAGVSAAVESLAKRLDRLEGGEPVRVEKQELAKSALEIQRLCKKRDHLQDRLEQVWCGEGVSDRKGKQDRLLQQIDDVEAELAGLRKSDNGLDLSDNPAAFRYRGGRSYRSFAHVNLNDSTALGVAKSDGLKKGSDDIADYDDGLCLSNWRRRR